jgi:hypothetical protein
MDIFYSFVLRVLGLFGQVFLIIQYIIINIHLEFLNCLGVVLVIFATSMHLEFKILDEKYQNYVNQSCLNNKEPLKSSKHVLLKF